MLTARKNQKEKEKLKRNPSTISIEINRNGSGLRRNYLPSLADQRTTDRKKRFHIRDR